MAAINNCGFELIQHTPHSPVLAQPDFHLFPKLKNTISGTHCQWDDDVIHVVEDFLGSQEKDIFKNGVEALQRRWQKCLYRYWVGLC